MLVSCETRYQGQVVELNIETVALPNGEQCALEIVRHPGGVAIVALRDDGRICLLRQYRHAAGGWIWELPAGRIEINEDTAVTARRELVEEAGFEARNWRYLGKTLSSPGIFTEVIHLYLASDLEEVGQRLEAFEVLEVHWRSLAEIEQMVVAGDVCDAKTLVALYFLKLYQPDLGLANG